MNDRRKSNKCKKTLYFKNDKIIHNTYVILCNELLDMFTSGIIVLTTPEDIVTIESKIEGKDQESIQSSTTLGPGYQWEIKQLYN